MRHMQIGLLLLSLLSYNIFAAQSADGGNVIAAGFAGFLANAIPLRIADERNIHQDKDDRFITRDSDLAAWGLANLAALAYVGYHFQQATKNNPAEHAGAYAFAYVLGASTGLLVAGSAHQENLIMRLKLKIASSETNKNQTKNSVQ